MIHFVSILFIFFLVVIDSTWRGLFANVSYIVPPLFYVYFVWIFRKEDKMHNHILLIFGCIINDVVGSYLLGTTYIASIISIYASKFISTLVLKDTVQQRVLYSVSAILIFISLLYTISNYV